MTTVTIQELTARHRTWTSRHRTAEPTEARARAVARAYGAGAYFLQDAGLPRGYGQIVRDLSARARGSGSTWAATVLHGRVSVAVDAA